MNVYEVRADLAYGVFTQVREDDDQTEWERRHEAGGKPNLDGWHPPRLESPRGRARVLPLDCIASALSPGLDMLLNARARKSLAPLLLACGEYLPVLLQDLDYCCFNCTVLIDVADQERIEGRRSKYRDVPPDCWDHITRWSFHAERLPDVPAIFTVPQRSFQLMCTDALREAVEAHDLLGFQFDLLWSPEAGGVEIDTSPGRFFGESGRQMNIAGRERRKAMQKRLATRVKSEATAFPT